MTVEILNNLIPTLDINEIEELLMTFIDALEVIENKTFNDLLEEYNVEFIDTLDDYEISKKQIETIYKMQSKIFNR